MHYARNKTQYCQQDIQPKCATYTDGEKDSKGWDENGKKYPDKAHVNGFFCDCENENSYKNDGAPPLKGLMLGDVNL